jgi:hypothetical protein
MPFKALMENTSQVNEGLRKNGPFFETSFFNKI